MCVDIGYTALLSPDGLPRYVKGVKISKEYAAVDRSQPHLQAHARPACWVILQKDVTPEVTSMHWGLIADFMVGRPDQFEKYGNNFFNARSERILDHNAAWHKYIHDRCLLVADGVYEHQKVSGRSRKMPWYIKLSSGAPLLIPSLFNPRTQTFAILTREGNELFRTIHNDGPNKFRMPLLLQPQQALHWIDPKLNEVDMQGILQTQLSSDQLKAHTVYSIRGGGVRPDGKEANEPFGWR